MKYGGEIHHIISYYISYIQMPEDEKNVHNIAIGIFGYQIRLVAFFTKMHRLKNMVEKSTILFLAI
jgi:hypothetical protein